MEEIQAISTAESHLTSADASKQHVLFKTKLNLDAVVLEVELFYIIVLMNLKF